MPRTVSAWIHRMVLVGLLVVAYELAWSPTRSVWISHGAAPLLERVLDVTDQQRAMTVRSTARTLYIETTGEMIFRYTAPAGIKFLLPGLFLLIIAPRHPRIGVFFAGHLVLGLLTLLLLSGETAGMTGNAQIADFIQSYGVDAYSLTVPIFVLAQRVQQTPNAEGS